jgi:quercetin dioxygenase-like cupin family protein
MQASHSPHIGQSNPSLTRCEQSEVTCAYALQVLPTSEITAAEAHIAACPDCRRELESLRPVVDRFVSWPTDVLRPTTSLQARLARRIAEETGKEPVPPPAQRWSEPGWEEVAPGIECKLLATDTERRRVSMLVRLAPGASYPAHTHAGVEEVHLLDGELWIDERKLLPGDYNYGAPGAGDERASGARPAAPVFSSPAPTTSCADHGEPPPYHAFRLAWNRPRPFRDARLPIF